MRTQRRSIGVFLAAFAVLGLIVSMNVQYSLDLSGTPRTMPVTAVALP